MFTDWMHGVVVPLRKQCAKVVLRSSPSLGWFALQTMLETHTPQAMACGHDGSADR